MWTFILILQLVSFGGEIKAVITANDEMSCWRIRAALIRALGGIENINGRVEGCRPTAPASGPQP